MAVDVVAEAAEHHSIQDQIYDEVFGGFGSFVHNKFNFVDVNDSALDCLVRRRPIQRRDFAKDVQLFMECLKMDFAGTVLSFFSPTDLMFLVTDYDFDDWKKLGLSTYATPYLNRGIATRGCFRGQACMCLMRKGRAKFLIHLMTNHINPGADGSFETPLIEGDMHNMTNMQKTMYCNWVNTGKIHYIFSSFIDRGCCGYISPSVDGTLMRSMYDYLDAVCYNMVPYDGEYSAPFQRYELLGLLSGVLLSLEFEPLRLGDHMYVNPDHAGSPYINTTLIRHPLWWGYNYEYGLDIRHQSSEYDTVMFPRTLGAMHVSNTGIALTYTDDDDVTHVIEYNR